MITLGRQHCRIAPARRGATSRWGVLLVAGLALGAVGCSQTTSPTATETAIAGPLVLNSAPGALPPAEAAAPLAVAPSSAPTTATAAPAPVPVVTTATAPVSASQPTTLPTALQPAPTAAGDDGQFPNINKPPTQPGGTLLPEAARAQIIADLEALRAGQTAPGAGGGGGNPADLATQAQTHGEAAIRQIEACSEDGALENNPACAPAD